MELPQRTDTQHVLSLLLQQLIGAHDAASPQVALAGCQMGTDRYGNQVMLNPQVAVAAIALLNKMQGHHAPEKVEVTQIDKSEVELRASIAKLQQEYNQLR